MSTCQFNPPKLICNPHIQTALPELITLWKKPKIQHEVFQIDDNQQFVLAHRPTKEAENNTILLLIPGIEGSYQSAIVKLLLCAKPLSSYTIYILTHRGIHTPNNQLSLYHAGLTDDLSTSVDYIKKQHPLQSIHAVGFSMGANILLKYLSSDANRIDLAAAISTPFDLNHCASTTPVFYQKRILKRIRHRIRHSRAAASTAWIQKVDWSSIQSIKDFDRLVTAPYFGFSSVEAYYQQQSCAHLLERITCPTSLVSATDDPFIKPVCWPDPRSLPPNMQLIPSPHGGHVGFIDYQAGLQTWIASLITT